MGVTLLITGIPRTVSLEDIAYSLDKLFETDEIGTFHVKRLSSNEKIVVLEFYSGFDAMTAQELLNGYRYSLPNGKERTIKASISKIRNKLSDSATESSSSSEEEKVGALNLLRNVTEKEISLRIAKCAGKHKKHSKRYVLKRNKERHSPRASPHRRRSRSRHDIDEPRSSKCRVREILPRSPSPTAIPSTSRGSLSHSRRSRHDVERSSSSRRERESERRSISHSRKRRRSHSRRAIEDTKKSRSSRYIEEVDSDSSHSSSLGYLARFRRTRPSEIRELPTDTRSIEPKYQRSGLPDYTRASEPKYKSRDLLLPDYTRANKPKYKAIEPKYKSNLLPLPDNTRAIEPKYKSSDLPKYTRAKEPKHHSSVLPKETQATEPKRKPAVCRKIDITNLLNDTKQYRETILSIKHVEHPATSEQFDIDTNCIKTSKSPTQANDDMHPMDIERIIAQKRDEVTKDLVTEMMCVADTLFETKYKELEEYREKVIEYTDSIVRGRLNKLNVDRNMTLIQILTCYRCEHTKSSDDNVLEMLLDSIIAVKNQAADTPVTAKDDKDGEAEEFPEVMGDTKMWSEVDDFLRNIQFETIKPDPDSTNIETHIKSEPTDFEENTTELEENAQQGINLLIKTEDSDEPPTKESDTPIEEQSRDMHQTSMFEDNNGYPSAPIMQWVRVRHEDDDDEDDEESNNVDMPSDSLFKKPRRRTFRKLRAKVKHIRRPRGDGPKTISPNPKFTLSIKLILKQMKVHYKEIDTEKKDIITEALAMLLGNDIREMLIGREYMNFRAIICLYRDHFPSQYDSGLIGRVILSLRFGSPKDIKHLITGDHDELLLKSIDDIKIEDDVVVLQKQNDVVTISDSEDDCEVVATSGTEAKLNNEPKVSDTPVKPSGKYSLETSLTITAIMCEEITRLLSFVSNKTIQYKKVFVNMAKNKIQKRLSDILKVKFEHVGEIHTEYKSLYSVESNELLAQELMSTIDININKLPVICLSEDGIASQFIKKENNDVDVEDLRHCVQTIENTLRVPFDLNDPVVKIETEIVEPKTECEIDSKQKDKKCTITLEQYKARIQSNSEHHVKENNETTEANPTCLESDDNLLTTSVQTNIIRNPDEVNDSTAVETCSVTNEGNIDENINETVDILKKEYIEDEESIESIEKYIELVCTAFDVD